MDTPLAAAPPAAARGRRLLVIAAAVHILMLALYLTGALSWMFPVTSLPARRGDSLFAFYQAGVNLRAGVSPYTDPAQLDPALVRAHSVSPFRYSPVVALVFSGLSRISRPETLYWVWLGVLEGVLWLCVLLTLRARRFGHRRYAAAAMWLAFTPFCVELYLGQISTLMALGILVLLLDAAGARPVGEGRWRSVLLPLAWAGTMLIKVFTVLFAAAYFRAGKRGMVLGGGGIVLVLCGAYFATHPADLRHFMAVNSGPFVGLVYPGLMGFQAFIRSIADHVMPASLRSVYVGLGPLDVSLANLPAAVIIPVIVALGLWGTWRLRSTDEFRGLALWIAVFFLIYRQVWEYHYVMFIPVVACAYMMTGARWSVWAWAIMALPTPYALLNLVGGGMEQSPLWILLHAAKPLAVVISFVALFPWRVPVLRPEAARVPRPTGDWGAAPAAVPALEPAVVQRVDWSVAKRREPAGAVDELVLAADARHPSAGAEAGE